VFLPASVSVAQKELSMKLTRISRCIVAGASFLLAAHAFAAHSGSLHVNAAETVAGKQLAAGDYTVRWDGDGPGVQLSIMRGAKLMAVVPARMIVLKSPPLDDTVVLGGDGRREDAVTQISFAGQSVAFEIEEVSVTEANRKN
jgi:hypothetical protein